jgi:hypothetical protein
VHFYSFVFVVGNRTDLVLITDPDPKLHIIPDPVRSGYINLPAELRLTEATTLTISTTHARDILYTTREGLTGQQKN